MEFNNRSLNSTSMKQDFGRFVRISEIIGYALSGITLTASLIIFRRLGSLRNLRTSFHSFRFAAVLTRVVIRLLLYVEKFIVRKLNNKDNDRIINTPYVCKVFFAIEEYSMSAVAMWAAVETIIMRSCIRNTGRRFNYSLYRYAAFCYGLPLLNITVWAVFNALFYSNEVDVKCWDSFDELYSFNKLYWIMHLPRITVIICNTGFLINTKILAKKLRKTHKVDLTNFKKTLKEACIVHPVLGFINMAAATIDYEAWTNNAWYKVVLSGSILIIRAFQGTILACIYCFMNRQMHTAVKTTSNNIPPEIPPPFNISDAERGEIHQSLCTYRACYK